MRVRAWGIPAVYAVAAILAGLTLPRIERYLFPWLVSTVTVAEATAIYSAIASGMIALTGVVFSLAFVMVQFSATAYSPRLVSWVSRDPVLSHALGTFTATFLYAIAALAGVDRAGSGAVPFLSLYGVVALLVASVAMFISLIQRVGVLQISRVLIFIGDEGRRSIESTYPSPWRALSPTAAEAAPDAHSAADIQTLRHQGRPRAIQWIDTAALVRLARHSRGLVQIVVAVGDTVVESMPLLRVFGAQAIDERALRAGIHIGEERTFAQDPKFAIRLLVDIAIRALSPAVNDPSTAVQALDQLEDLLLRLSHRHLAIGTCRDDDGTPRLVLPCPDWDDLLSVAFDEIASYGATSVQVMRRMNALLDDLISAVPDARRPALNVWQGRLRVSITRSFADGPDRQDASTDDRQGLGVPRQRRPPFMREPER